EDGEEAVEMMGRGRTTIAILSLVLPRLDALSTIARIRMNEKLRGVPVLVLVPSDLPAIEVRRLNDSAEEIAESVVGKPAPILDLIGAELEGGTRIERNGGRPRGASIWRR